MGLLLNIKGYSFSLQMSSNSNHPFTEMVWKEPRDLEDFFFSFQDKRHLLSFREAPVLIVFPAHVLLLFAIKEFISGELTLLFREGTCSYLGEACKSKHVEPLKREIKRCWQEGMPAGLGDFLTTCIIRQAREQLSHIKLQGGERVPEIAQMGGWLASSVSLGRGGVQEAWKDNSLLSLRLL